MKYKNAKDIFPENLLRQIQKYVSGELIYIPSDTKKKKEWGETSGYRRYLYERNRDIKTKFSDGHNKAFSDGLKLFDRYWIGPITIKEEHAEFLSQYSEYLNKES